METLGEQFRQARFKAARTLADIGKEISVSPATLSRIEHGGTPSLRAWQAVNGWLRKQDGEPQEAAESIMERMCADAWALFDLDPVRAYGWMTFMGKSFDYVTQMARGGMDEANADQHPV